MNNFDTLKLGEWEVRPIHDNTPRWRVVNNKTGEDHIAHSHKSATFLSNLFNEQSRWYEYRNYGFITTTTNGLLGSNRNYSITSHPKPNWRFYIGDSTLVYFELYFRKPPNLIQRWLIKKILGITWEPIN
jgi:hypothetical protein